MQHPVGDALNRDFGRHWHDRWLPDRRRPDGSLLGNPGDVIVVAGLRPTVPRVYPPVVGSASAVPTIASAAEHAKSYSERS